MTHIIRDKLSTQDVFSGLRKQGLVRTLAILLLIANTISACNSLFSHPETESVNSAEALTLEYFTLMNASPNITTTVNNAAIESFIDTAREAVGEPRLEIWDPDNTYINLEITSAVTPQRVDLRVNSPTSAVQLEYALGTGNIITAEEISKLSVPVSLQLIQGLLDLGVAQGRIKQSEANSIYERYILELALAQEEGNLELPFEFTPYNQ